MTGTAESPVPELWVVVPAAGSGTRIGSEVPKQYLPLVGVAVLQRTLQVLLEVPGLQKIFVATRPQHTALFESLQASSSNYIQTVPGTDQRVGSVAAGVAAVREEAGDNAWVLVHDAARPLVSLTDICNLVSAVIKAQSVGGLLATPVIDTVKKSDSASACLSTVPREKLWLAQTPQMFRAGQLADAIESALAMQHADKDLAITDEASVFELAGLKPLLVESHSPNMKITMPQDFALAEAILSLRQNN
ncbi:2-C-methyl-D-erythritol 4-phosphate cytidylyltransferase [Chromatiales bacterium (ex Bugula neritina AB1)]|nr:2-C-methyl-D-erythritol 4-phosphate cytidylyltransferase [Chromatiales bacterium (ex Bugula neritina AB1)]